MISNKNQFKIIKTKIFTVKFKKKIIKKLKFAVDHCNGKELAFIT